MNNPKLYAGMLSGAVMFLVGCDTPGTSKNTPPRVFVDSTALSLNALETTNTAIITADADGDAVTLSLTSAPSWLVLEGGNSLRASPVNGNVGEHAITLTASDGIDSIDLELTLSVAANNPLPALTDYRTRALTDEVFYFVMTDRFSDGDSTNNEGDLGDPLTSGGYDKTDAGFYHGGDLQGLTDKISYIEDLGATAIWLTPILKNKAVQGDSAGYHGYWTLDFTNIDSHLGGNIGLAEFIEAAHARNIKVFFDIVVNHSADVIKFEQCHNSDGSLLAGVSSCTYKSLAEVDAGEGYTPFIPSGEENAKTPAWLNDVQFYNNQGESTFAGENSVYGDFSGLDDIDTTDVTVADNFIDVFKDLIRDFRPDGFRVDTVKHVNTEFWQRFSPPILAYAQAPDTDGLGTNGAGITNFTLFGEVYSADPTLLSYYTTEAKLPSVLDFAFQSFVTSAIQNQGDAESIAQLNEMFSKDDLYADADSDASTLINFVGNHDMGRFANFLGDFLAFDSRAVQMTDLAHALMYFARGIPTIYYGDEQGFIGSGGDKAARQDMMPSQVGYYNATNMLGTERTSADDNFTADHPLYLKWREYARLLRENPTLRHGIQIARTSSASNTFAFSRLDRDSREEYLVVANFNKDRPKTTTVAAAVDTYLAVYGSSTDIVASDGLITVTVPALSLVIFKADGAVPDSVSPSLASVTGPQADSLVAGNVEYTVTLTGASDLAVPTYQVELQVSEDAGGNWATVASDPTFPYQLYLQTTDIADQTALSTRVRATNTAGDEDVSTALAFTVDKRAPVVTLDYEGAASGKRLAVVSASGQTQTFAADTPVTFQWTDFEDRLLVYFTQGVGSLAVDQPIWLTRAATMDLAADNPGTNQLEANLFVNVGGAVAVSDNDLGTGVVNIDQGGAATLGALNIRGSLNDWGVTAMTYQNGYYYGSQTLAIGDIEYKFADANWTSVIIGGPIGELGMTRSANPGNLNQLVEVAGTYDFYLIIADLDDDGNADDYLHLMTLQP
jgi:glycosidase